ncbi:MULTISPECIES: helix-turn-helix transcriptional regulator [Methylotenera]|jgi:DNA-binding transcriptional ArsR family regulator|uniref:ArsR family transcriptional regulator n=1 Tax=Methylotenera mobilis TaxID=359408 RepID=A0A351R973_9PROT|nr:MULTISPECIES: helix-turn-helix domain-containing protein [Methylotenera]MDP3212216.1 helix-turn-helix domain-containing protein [Methylotenera sp.]PPC97043.1 MAG: ArsR family transcriptional regulator [Methylotenera sp.]HBA08594.1 ArsR family transcriptional regulator [Methylotenera mobilis]
MRQIKHPTIEQVELTDIMYALADPTRLEIIALLAKAGKKLTCGEINLNRPKSSMSHHFKILRGAGLVQTLIEGTEHMNSLRLEEIEQKYPGVLSAVLKALTKD